VSDRLTVCLISRLVRASARRRAFSAGKTTAETSTERNAEGRSCHITTKDINWRIAAEVSWSRTVDRSARTRPARQAFLKRFEKEVDPNGEMPLDERYRRAEHALRAHTLRLAKTAVAARQFPITALPNPCARHTA
jgi:hypothetical protein